MKTLTDDEFIEQLKYNVKIPYTSSFVTPCFDIECTNCKNNKYGNQSAIKRQDCFNDYMKQIEAKKLKRLREILQ